MEKNQLKYQYRPVRFYLFVFAFTWAFWIPAAFVPEHLRTTFMLHGLLVPSITVFITILTSNAGQSLKQFSFVEDFSFSIGGTPTLLVLALAAFLEELGWRGYAEDSIASYCSWWKESVIFGLVWALWHLPLFFIQDTYHYNILQQNPLYMANFFVSIMPLGFIVTWVYVKNSRSILASMIFHFFVNILQERVALTQTTKCVETLVLFAAAAVVVALNRDLFFEKRHIGSLLGEMGEKNE